MERSIFLFRCVATVLHVNQSSTLWLSFYKFHIFNRGFTFFSLFSPFFKLLKNPVTSNNQRLQLVCLYLALLIRQFPPTNSANNKVLKIKNVFIEALELNLRRKTFSKKTSEKRRS